MGQQVLVIGSNQAGLQAARDLADCGLQVHLVENSPYLGSGLPPLHAQYLQNEKLLDILKDPRIKVWTDSSVQEVSQANGRYQVQLERNPRYIDLARCTACGECVEVCPITVPGTDLKAIHFGGQPDCAVIEKWGISPCTNACPAGIHVQGYVALINKGRYEEAYRLIYDALPFPSVCGRVCNHYCEQACSRSQLDEPVNLMALKRYVADWAYQHPDQTPPAAEKIARRQAPPAAGSGKRVAVIGAGPAGLTAARDLVRSGHQATVFDDNPSAGGMMRVGIPPHRLPYQQLDWEINKIVEEGVDLRLDSWVDDIPGLLNSGFDAVLIATGAHQAIKAGIEGADHPDNWLSLEFLKKACLGEKIDLSGRRVIVLGGGDVAMDAARVAVRLGTSEVKVVCRGMRASFTEVTEAEEEGVEIIRGRVFQKIVLEGKKIAGVECLEAEVGDVIDGKRQFSERPGTEHLIPGDLVIWALGQKPDFSFLPPDGEISIEKNSGLKADSQLMTTLEGVFTAGDVHRGTTFFVVDAVGDGHRAAEAIHGYLMDLPPREQGPSRQEVNLSLSEMDARLSARRSARETRRKPPCLEVADRSGNFAEVDLALGDEDVLIESGRCLVCGPCSECMACVEVCEPGAINHFQSPSSMVLDVEMVLAEQGNHVPDDIPGLVYFSSKEPIAGSAAAFDVIKDIKTLPGVGSGGYVPSRGTRTGLVLCQCGGKISDMVNTGALKDEFLGLPEVDYSGDIAFACTAEGTSQLKKIIDEESLGKLILAACSCCSLDQVCYSCTYQRLRCKENLGVFSSMEAVAELGFVNIREQCAWVHRKNKKQATGAARQLIRAAIAREPAVVVESPRKPEQPFKVLVLGRGKSGHFFLESLAGLGLVGESVEVLSGEVVRVGGKYATRGKGGPIEADMLVLAPESRAELDHISGYLKLSNQTPLISRDHIDQDPGRLGLVLCPPELDPVLSAKAGAARIYAWLNRTYNQEKPRSAVVDWQRCRTCGTCQEVCGFGIPVLIADGPQSRAWINPFLCQDCGVCSAHCPSGAITPATHPDSELEHMLEMVLS